MRKLHVHPNTAAFRSLGALIAYPNATASEQLSICLDGSPSLSEA